jgi:hypothetical protein
MTALIMERQNTMERWTHHLFTLAAGNKAWKNGKCGLDMSTGRVEPMHAETDLLYIGIFDETIDAAAGEQLVNVNLGMEIEIRWWNNDTVAPIAATAIGSICYSLDDQTVTADPTARSVAGRVWAVDSALGVGVQKLEALSPRSRTLSKATLPAYVANDAALAGLIASGSSYDIPATTGATTVSLGAGDDGDILYFSADGVANGHTVQYRDGVTPITTALTASKRHLVVCLYLNGKWRANAYVSP